MSEKQTKYDMVNPGPNGVYAIGAKQEWFRKFVDGTWYHGADTPKTALHESQILEFGKNVTVDDCDTEDGLFYAMDMYGQERAIVEARRNGIQPIEPEQMGLFE